MTIFMQNALHIPPVRAGMVFLPLTLAFVIASRHSAMRARRRGTLVLIEGCALQMTGLATLALTVALDQAPSASLLALMLTIFGYGQGLAMAPLSSAVLSTVKPASAGSGAGMYGTVAQIANAAGVAVIGAVFFATQAALSAEVALFVSLALFVASIALCAAFLSWRWRAAPVAR
jgi:predicted MFS family arabinose efflux permease